jgi:hypothetical protein
MFEVRSPAWGCRCSKLRSVRRLQSQENGSGGGGRLLKWNTEFWLALNWYVMMNILFLDTQTGIADTLLYSRHARTHTLWGKTCLYTYRPPALSYKHSVIHWYKVSKCPYINTNESRQCSFLLYALSLTHALSMVCKRPYSFSTQNVNGSNSQNQPTQSLVSLDDQVTIRSWWQPQLIARTEHKLLHLQGLRF